MPKFQIEIIRRVIERCTVIVEAEDEYAAWSTECGELPDGEWVSDGCDDSDLEITDVSEA